MTRAAERLGIAQPALSQSLRRMEERLGVRLFNRSRRGVTLNPVGQAILDDLRAGVTRLDAAVARAQQVSQGLAGTLTVGFVASASFELLPRALRRFKTQSPQVRVVLREMGNIDLMDALERGEIDIALLYTPGSVSARLRQQPLARNRLVAAVHEGFAVSGDGKVSLRDLAHAGLVMLSERQVPLLRDALIGALVRLDEEYRVVQEVERTLTALACVAARIGVSVLPGATRRVEFHGVRYCDIRERSLLPELQLSALWPARARPGVAERFAQTLEHSVRSL